MRFIHSWKLYERIPMKSKSILLDEGFDKRKVNLVDANDGRPLMAFEVYCKPKPAPGIRWGHRVMVICDCGKHVPFGRMGQHWGKPTCGAVS
jgi:hypothetical protein